MRRLACSLLVVFLVAPADAQERGGWVDPPARPVQPQATSAPSEPMRAEPMRAKSGRMAKVPAGTEASPDRRVASKPTVDRQAKYRLSVPAASSTSTPSPENAARRTVSAYLAAVSSDDAIVSSTSRFYGDRVRFHGRVMTRAALAADKARFARRWPDRRYAPFGDARTTCDAARNACTVTTAFVFRAANPARGTRSAGIGELTLMLDVAGERPVILSESSRVLRRGAAAFGPSGRSGDDA